MADYLETVDQWEKKQLAKLAHMLAYWQKQPVQAAKEIPENIGAAGRNIGAYTAGFVGDVASIVPGAQMAAGGQAPTSEDLLEEFGRKEHWSNLPAAFVAPGPGEVKGILKAMLGLSKEMSGTVGLAQALFHGTPHRFDKFELEKIGTGEGAQAYGHGLYFAESPGVAKSYTTGRTIDTNTPEGAAWAAIQDSGGDVDKALKFLDDDFRAAEQYGPHYKAARKLVHDGFEPPAGHLYEVDIPDETIAKMLDWDAPLSEQPESVRKAIENHPALNATAGDAGRRVKKIRDVDPTGQDLYETMVANIGAPDARHAANKEAASMMLNEAGIPGIRFFDAQSRNVGTNVARRTKVNGTPIKDFAPDTGDMLVDSQLDNLMQHLEQGKSPSEVLRIAEKSAEPETVAAFKKLNIDVGEGTRNIVVFNPDDITTVKRDGELVYKAGKKKSLDEIIDIVDKY